jgi:hypothetical protein
MLTLERAHELLKYDPATGILRWRMRRGSRSAWAECNSIDGDGYIRITIEGRRYSGHRIAWLLHYGKWPVNLLDHKDRIRTNNRIENLRDVTNVENLKNQGPRSRRRPTGCRGTHFIENRSKWAASICVNGTKRHLGYFDTEGEANAAYRRAIPFPVHTGEYGAMGLPV